MAWEYLEWDSAMDVALIGQGKRQGKKHLFVLIAFI